MASAPCSCGSGRSFRRCHGDPANAFARTQALLEARQLAGLFPAVRLRSERVLHFAQRAAGQLGTVNEVPDELLAEGIELVAACERRELVDGWATAYPDRWQSLCHAAGDTAAAEREIVIGALDVAIAERQPVPRDLLAVIESDRLRPAWALAIVLPPQCIWSLDEARAASAAAEGRDPAAATRAVCEVATALGLEAHAARVRGLASNVAAELPVDGYPRASRVLVRGCDRVAQNLPFAREVLALTLSAYVTELSIGYSSGAAADASAS